MTEFDKRYHIDVAWAFLIVCICAIGALFLNHWDRKITRETERAKVTAEYQKAIRAGKVIDVGDRKIRIVEIVNGEE